MELSSLELTAAVAVVSTGISVFATFCPDLPKVLADNRSHSVKSELSFGQNAAVVATVSVGTVLSFITKSPMPLVFAIAIAALMTFAYEFAFRKEFH